MNHSQNTIQNDLLFSVESRRLFDIFDKPAFMTQDTLIDDKENQTENNDKLDKNKIEDPKEVKKEAEKSILFLNKNLSKIPLSELKQSPEKEQLISEVKKANSAMNNVNNSILLYNLSSEIKQNIIKVKDWKDLQQDATNIYKSLKGLNPNGSVKTAQDYTNNQINVSNEGDQNREVSPIEKIQDKMQEIKNLDKPQLISNMKTLPLWNFVIGSEWYITSTAYARALSLKLGENLNNKYCTSVIQNLNSDIRQFYIWNKVLKINTINNFSTIS